MHSIRILPLGRILIERIEEFVLLYRIDGFLKEAYILIFYTHSMDYSIGIFVY